MKFAVLMFVSLVLASCFNEGDCLISATNYVHFQFKKKTNITTDTTVAFTSITVSNSNSALIQDSLASELLIPLDIGMDATSTTFVFHIINPNDSSVTATDTLQVNYTKQSKVISRDCGAFTFYHNLKIIRTNLSSAQIKIISTDLIKDPTSSGPSAYAINYQILY